MKRSRARAPEAIEFARWQRAAANEFARTVWQWVRNRQICAQKCRREYAIPPYTADFCCVELRLTIEIDGADHVTEDGRQRDRVRDDFLSRHGYRVVRISGYDVLREPSSCRARIVEQVQQRMREMESGRPSPPAPLPEAGRGETRRSRKRGNGVTARSAAAELAHRGLRADGLSHQPTRFVHRRPRGAGVLDLRTARACAARVVT